MPAGKRVLIVEDDFMACQAVIGMLEPLAYVVVGPVGTVQDALHLLEHDTAGIDAAIVDVNLHGEMSYPVADALSHRNIPFVFATGYDAGDLPPRYRGCRRVQKPFQRDALALALA